MTSLGTAPATGPLSTGTSLLIDKWNGTDFQQWNNSVLASGGVSSATASLSLVAGAAGRNKMRLTGSVVVNATPGFYVIRFLPRITLPTRYILGYRMSGGTGNTANHMAGAFPIMTNASGSSFFGICQGLTQTGTSYVARCVEAGVCGAPSTITGSVGGGYVENTSPGIRVRHAVRFTNPVVTDPAFAIQTQTYAQDGTTLEAQVGGCNSTQLYATYTGWSGLDLRNIGVGGFMTANGTFNFTYDFEEWFIMKHPLDW